MKRAFSAPLFFIFVLCMAQLTDADIIINEVMSNEPSSEVSLEWIELYNDSDSAKTLTYYSLSAEGEIFSFAAYSVGPREYFVVCRRLFASTTSAGFESRWGDGSGVWGDDGSENYQVYQFSNMSLPNDSGSVTLYYVSAAKSTFKWTEKGSDGVSWERFTAASSVVARSQDPSGGTPGRENSITPAANDLALLSAIASPEAGGRTSLEYAIANLGLNDFSNATLSVYYDNDRDSATTLGDLIRQITLPDFEVGDTFYILDAATLVGTYPSLLARLSSDDRAANNQILFHAVGEDYPPIVINEFIADPEAPLQTEWIEIKSRSDSAISLQGWLVGDSTKLAPISPGPNILNPGEYIVLCEDIDLFKTFYSGFDGRLIGVSSWARLNNGGDKVRLVDSLGFDADEFSYELVYGGNFSWGRGPDAEREGSWGRSIISGGSPGEANEIYYQATAAKISVAVEPNPFSPERDGQTKIDFSVPPGDNLIICVYNLAGLKVATLLDNIAAVDGSIVWDGLDDDGDRLPPGIYILSLEVSDVGQYKQTIVVAP
jgi:hypothetical protein